MKLSTGVIFLFFIILASGCRDDFSNSVVHVNPEFSLEDGNGRLLVNSSRITEVRVVVIEGQRRIYLAVDEFTKLNLMRVDELEEVVIVFHGEKLANQPFEQLIGSGGFSVVLRDMRIQDRYLSDMILAKSDWR